MKMISSKQSINISALDARYRLAESMGYEVNAIFLQLAISAGCKDYYSEVEKTLKEVGTMKYLRPLYTALVQGPGKEEENICQKDFWRNQRLLLPHSSGCSRVHPFQAHIDWYLNIYI